MTFKPTDLNTCCVHLDPEVAYFDPSGTAGEVHHWVNNGWLDTYFARGNTTAQPMLQRHNTKLGRPAMRAEGSDLYMRSWPDYGHDWYHGTYLQAQSWTVIAVVGVDSVDFNDNGMQTLCTRTWGDVNYVARVQIVHTEDIPSKWGFGPLTDSDGILPDVTVDTGAHIYEFTFNGTVGEGWIDGVSSGTDTKRIDWGFVDSIRLFSSTQADDIMDGDLGDFLMFNGELDAHERGAVRGYLARKYNIQVTA